MSAPAIARGKRMRNTIARAVASPAKKACHEIGVAPTATASAIAARRTSERTISARAITLPSSGLRPPSPRSRGEGQRSGLVAPRPAKRGEAGAERRVRGGSASLPLLDYPIQFRRGVDDVRSGAGEVILIDAHHHRARLQLRRGAKERRDV